MKPIEKEAIPEDATILDFDDLDALANCYIAPDGSQPDFSKLKAFMEQMEDMESNLQSVPEVPEASETQEEAMQPIIRRLQKDPTATKEACLLELRFCLDQAQHEYLSSVIDHVSKEELLELSLLSVKEMEAYVSLKQMIRERSGRKIKPA